MKIFAYHNTNNAIGIQLERYENVALSQEERLLAYFKAAYEENGQYVRLTPTNALILVFSKKVPITSVRRALSNLTRDGRLSRMVWRKDRTGDLSITGG